MPRTSRSVIVGYPHHVTQRGNNKENIFIDKADYTHYLKWAEEYAVKYKLLILAYCLMPNHVHFAVVPSMLDALSKSLKICHMLYAQYFNRRNARVGHLWQGRFYSSTLEESHLYAVIRYIENNPVRAGLVAKAEDWQWSSAREHLRIDERNRIVTLSSVREFIEVKEWEDYLRSEDTMMESKIRNNTLSGKPIGSDEFVGKLENVLGRKLKPMQMGRPLKERVVYQKALIY